MLEPLKFKITLFPATFDQWRVDIMAFGELFEYVQLPVNISGGMALSSYVIEAVVSARRYWACSSRPTSEKQKIHAYSRNLQGWCCEHLVFMAYSP
jgi:hypothetical protein